MTTDDDSSGIGAEEARELNKWILDITAPARQALIIGCAAACPPGKNKRLNKHTNHHHNQSDDVRRAA